MDCENVRETLSAQLDGEELESDLAVAHAHLDQCAACSAYSSRLSDLHRAVRLRTPAVIPDLTGQVLSRVETPHRFHPEWARYALFTVALSQLVIAIPGLIMTSQSNTAVHLTREVSSWTISLAIALLYAAWRPDRALGLLPFVLALGGTMFVTATLDVTAGHTSLFVEAPHALSLVGLVLLVVLASTNWWNVQRATPEPVL